MSTEAQSNQGHSIDGGRKNPRLKDIPFKLHIIRTLDQKVGLGCFHLEMPSNLEISKPRREGYPLLFLDIKDDDQLESFKMMKTLSHANILAVYLVDEVKGEHCRVYVERYLGVLSDLLETTGFVVNQNTGIVPSVAFQDIVSDIIVGLNYLRENDQYHGNLAWDTTLYVNDGSKNIVKLANLEKKRSKTPEEGQVEDCVSLGYALIEISERVKQLFHVSTCSLIDDLARLLISVTSGTLDAVMRDIKNNIFFWDERRRKTFAAVELPAAWYRAAFKTSFANSESVPNMPWTDAKYEGYLDAMEAYRAENNIAKYLKNEWIHFLRCISGMYTHQKEFKNKNIIISVDSAVHRAHPRLFRDLKVAVDLSN